MITKPPIILKRRERDAILQSFQAGLVPKQGLNHITVGRKAETSAIIADLERIANEGAAFRIVVGRFGSGKSFLLNLLRNYAFQKKLVIVTADFSMNRRLYATEGQARSLFSELMRNLAIRAQPEGGALLTILTTWASRIQHDVMQAGGDVEAVKLRMTDDLRHFQELVGGFEFSEVVQIFYRAYVQKNDPLQAAALKWLRGEYTTKAEARTTLGVRRIIDDENFYESLKLMATFVKRAGFSGLLVMLDELVVISHRLPSTRARQSNYEALLTILNDCFQGTCSSLGFILAGTDECLEDKRRGLHSYEALRTRLIENTLAKEHGLIDLSGPVVRLQPLTPEELFMLLKNIVLVHANKDLSKAAVPDEGIRAVLEKASETLGAEYFRTPRDIVRSFVGLLNLLDQNPSKTWADLLRIQNFEQPKEFVSFEEELAKGGKAAEDVDEDLVSFRL